MAAYSRSQIFLRFEMAQKSKYVQLRDENSRLMKENSNLSNRILELKLQNLAINKQILVRIAWLFETQEIPSWFIDLHYDAEIDAFKPEFNFLTDTDRFLYDVRFPKSVFEEALENIR